MLCTFGEKLTDQEVSGNGCFYTPNFLASLMGFSELNFNGYPVGR